MSGRFPTRNDANGEDGDQPAMIFKELDVGKHVLSSVRQKNDIASRIIDRLSHADSFLMLGHENPDEDCIGAMVAFALLAVKFDKRASIFVAGELHEQHHYLIEICTHNSIRVLTEEAPVLPPFDTLVVCDTPKPSMVAGPRPIDELKSHDGVVTIEFDHHMAADTSYIGDERFALVTEASSACELVGFLALKLCKEETLLERHHIDDLFSRNFVLAVLTGIIGDSKMGKFLKSSRERRFYDIFSGMFNELLTRKTTNRSNFSNKDEVFAELVRLSAREEACFSALMAGTRHSPSVHFVALDEPASAALFDEFDSDTIVTVARAVADALAEGSEKLSLIAYYDCSSPDGLVQFRVRRSHTYRDLDVRKILDRFSIENGGGHEGAIGFRFPRDTIDDFDAFVTRLVEGIESEVTPA